MISADGAELELLEQDLHKAAKRLPREMKQVVSKGSLNVKNDWRDRWKGHPKIKHIPRSIGYDLESGPDFAEGVIGPDKDQMQAPLANIIEFGSVNNAPIPGGQPALDTEEPKFVKAVGDMAEKLFGGRDVG